MPEDRAQMARQAGGPGGFPDTERAPDHARRELGSFLRVPDNLLAVVQGTDILRRLDAAFFLVGEARGGLLVKFCGGEKDREDELRATLEQNGLEAGRLEQEGRFLMRPERDPMDRHESTLERILEEGRTVWASFDWAVEVDLDTALEQQERLNELVEARQLVVKTAALSEVVDEWSSTELRQAQSLHSTTILAFESGLSLSRATPMPQS